jgi:cytosine/adenosine deaminase-related metal-dependent hydrolase
MKLIGARVARDATTTEKIDLTVRGRRISFSTDRHSRGAGARSPILDLTGFLVLPGLINAHDHLEFNLFPSLGRGTYTNAKNWAADIYQPDVSPVKEHLSLSKQTRMIWGGLKNLLSGVTTVAHHNPLEDTVLEVSFPVNVVKHFGWAHSLDFSPDLVERSRRTPEDWPFILHAAEGIDKHARAEIGRLEKLGVLSGRTVLVHAIGMDQPDLDLLRERRSSLVWCPSSNVSTFGQTLRARALQSDINIVLGTDSALTAQVDLIDELEVARQMYPLSAENLFEMVTTRSAQVLRLRDGEGTIREGGVADLVVVEDRGQSAAEALQRMQPEMVMVRGKVRVVSPRLLDRTSTLDAEDWHPVHVEGRGKWFTNVNLPSLHEHSIRVLGPEYRLAGRRISL